MLRTSAASRALTWEHRPLQRHPPQCQDPVRRRELQGLAGAGPGSSDEVQSTAGGIRLDTLFLDEGFGSLDEESLEQAIRVLSGLTEGDRLVGIISHVAALKDRIDRQVVVHKERSGGSWVEIVT